MYYTREVLLASGMQVAALTSAFMCSRALTSIVGGYVGDRQIISRKLLVTIGLSILLILIVILCKKLDRYDNYTCSTRISN